MQNLHLQISFVNTFLLVLKSGFSIILLCMTHLQMSRKGGRSKSNRKLQALLINAAKARAAKKLKCEKRASTPSPIF